MAEGTIAQDSKDAVNGGQLWDTNQRVSANEAGIAVLDGRVKGLNDKVNELDDDIKDTGALSAALSGLRPLPNAGGRPTQFMAAVSYYRGSYGGALGISHRLTEDAMLHSGFSFGSGSHVMANAGVSIALGKRIESLVNRPSGMDKLLKENAELKEDIAALKDELGEHRELIRELKEELMTLKQSQ